jgi:hypothetical protein
LNDLVEEAAHEFESAEREQGAQQWDRPEQDTIN